MLTWCMVVCEQSDNIPKSLAILWSKHILLQQVDCCKDKCLCPTSSYLTCWQIVIDVLSLVVGACALNQSRGHWLLNWCTSFCNNHGNKTNGNFGKSPSFDNIIDEDFRMVDELPLLASNIKKEVCVIFHLLLSFFSKKNEKKKSHNMLSLLLDPKFKDLRLVSSLIGQEQGFLLFMNMKWGPYFPYFSNALNIHIP